LNSKSKRISEKIKIGNKVLTLESGYLASQANEAILARLGDTMVLSTVVSTKTQEDSDYLPLGVEYVERLYAGGRIKGSRWVKREGRPSDEAILNARLIDRSIRPLFPDGYNYRIQVIITVLSVDAENSPDIPAIWATSAALSASNIPWQGPVAALRLGYIPKDGEENFIINPNYQDLEYSEMNIVFSGTKDALVMIEGEAREVPEETIVSALDYAYKQIKESALAIKNFAAKIAAKKEPFRPGLVNHDLVKKIKKEGGKEIEKAVIDLAVQEKEGVSLAEVKEALLEKFPEEEKKEVRAAIEGYIKEFVRSRTLKEGKRVDGRSPNKIRPLEIEVGVLPRTHGSAMFKRGSTQALTVVTLGSPSLEQLIESMEGEETKRYMHHYYMPPFSIGEVGRLGWPSRREIGHGALAEKALESVIPSEENFPYAIRVVSEIMASNGSTSMASVCGSSLSLMDAGVPIKSPVAGIAMGLISDGKKHVILTDILGLEDFYGDMDFKAAGTKKGITALQMDVKNTKIPIKILAETFQRAKEARDDILAKMAKVLPASRAQVSKFAPKVEVIHVPTEKIGEVIGPGGRMIRRIISETGAAIDIEDDGSVNISSPDKEAVDKAVAIIQGLTREVTVGEQFEGTVKRIEPFGAFVEIAPGKEGLVHVSRMSTGFVQNPADVVKIDQKVRVRVVEIDDLKRINLSMLSEEEERKLKASRPRPRFSGPKRDSFRKRPRFSSGPRRR
jgi:polyribonucleotide nucleotidyltransferase